VGAPTGRKSKKKVVKVWGREGSGGKAEKAGCGSEKKQGLGDLTWATKQTLDRKRRTTWKEERKNIAIKGRAKGDAQGGHRCHLVPTTFGPTSLKKAGTGQERWGGGMGGGLLNRNEPYGRG